jgi:NADPH2 dehydrogenase
MHGIDMSSPLFSPIRLASLELANRIVVSPMCQYSANDGVASAWHLTHLGMLANSGASLLVLEATGVERSGRITHGCLGLYSDACEAALARVVAHCRRIGSAKLGIQLGHAGRKASSQRPWEGGKALSGDEDPWPTIAPSARPFGANWPTPREITTSEMERVRDSFAAAARRAVRAGLDTIELHFAHGYLVHSFLSPLSNHRTDAYGGSLTARLRFAREIVSAVRAVLPSGFPLGARLTGSDWMDDGLTPDDAVVVVSTLKQAGLDFVCVSSGGITAETRNPTTPAYNAPIAEKVRNETGISTRTVGLIVAPKQAESIIAEGRADMVSLARAMLDDPHWAWHAAQELGADVTIPPQYLRAGPKLWAGAALRG